MMLSSSAVDRVSGIQTANHGETHRLRVLRAWLGQPNLAKCGNRELAAEGRSLPGP